MSAASAGLKYQCEAAGMSISSGHRGQRDWSKKWFALGNTSLDNHFSTQDCLVPLQGFESIAVTLPW